MNKISTLAAAIFATLSIGGAQAGGDLGKKGGFDIPGNADNLEFEFHGYLRAGIGASSNGGDQECYRTPGAGAKYRLGNECEIYNELFFGTTYRPMEGSAAAFTLNFRLANSVAGHADWEQFEPALRESWVGAKSVFGGSLAGSHFWVGKRFYRREDVHINDFYYWDASGNGGGIEDLDLGMAKSAFALFRDTESDKDAVTRFDFRLYDMKISENATLGLGGDVRFVDNDEGSTDDIADGWSLTGTLHTANWLGGWNKIAVQYGKGNGISFGAADFGASDGDSRFRVTNQMLIKPTDDLSMMLVGIYQNTDVENPVLVYDAGSGAFKADESKVDEEWFSLGVRPAYQITDHFALVFEAGYDLVSPETGPDREVTKFTFAPTITAGRGFFDRPQLRAYATYSMWNEGSTAFSDSDNLTDKGDDLTFGIQLEHWW